MEIRSSTEGHFSPFHSFPDFQRTEALNESESPGLFTDPTGMEQVFPETASSP